MTASPFAAPDPPPQPSWLLSYLRLLRLPNVFTALADVAMGLVYTLIPVVDGMAWAGLLVATACLYTAGMVLNDVADYDQDARERPFRPLPSGAISRQWAKTLGVWLLAGGVLGAMLAGAFAYSHAGFTWRPGLVAMLLGMCVMLYDGFLKRTPLGPVLMGGCRFFNVLLGMSLGVGGSFAWNEGVAGFSPDQLLVAGGIGVYIVGVTWFARTEAHASRRGPLLLGMVLMAVGLVMLAMFPRFGDFGETLVARQITVAGGNLGVRWPGLLLLLGFIIMRRAVIALSDPTPARVQATVKLCIMSLILLDAAVTLAVGGVVAGLCVLALLVPMLLLGRWVYST